MSSRIIIIGVLSLFFTTISCGNDDDEIEIIPLRDEAEVYKEDLEEIEVFLSTHFYNYEEFNDEDPYNASNDEFKIKIDTIAGDNASKIPLIDQVEFKTVEQGDIDYKLYSLKVREGNGNPLHSLDEAVYKFNGILTNREVFDSAITPVKSNVTIVGGQGGIFVRGFRESLLEFKTGTSSITAPNGTLIHKGHGIGAVFVPSGLAYFASAPLSIGAYNPIIFAFQLIARNDTDFDFDGIPSHIEDLDLDGDGFNDDTDGDGLPNFADSDDDGDNVLTENEDLEDTDPNKDSDGDGIFDNDKDGDGDPTNDLNAQGIPKYLDANSTESN